MVRRLTLRKMAAWMRFYELEPWDAPARVVTSFAMKREVDEQLVEQTPEEMAAVLKKAFGK